jgi:hypothetical protein
MTIVTPLPKKRKYLKFWLFDSFYSEILIMEASVAPPQAGVFSGLNPTVLQLSNPITLFIIQVYNLRTRCGFF